jgi:hypothetical protein
MAASVTSPADVVNLALRRIGYQLRVGQLFDGSKASNNALDIYAQTRDAVLREADWGFAETMDLAALSGGAAPAPWLFEYLYPVACVKLRDVLSTTYLANQNNPLPELWQLANAAAGKVIWTKVAASTVVFTRQVTDPAQWEPDFVEALAAALARRLAPVLVSLEAAKLAAEDEKVSTLIAEGVTG